MGSINYVIVEADSAYNNEVELNSGVKLVVNTTIESVAHINRIAKVVDAPEFTILQKGDEVIVHHNIFRLRNDTKGEVVQSNFHLEDNKYFVPLTEVFMYRRDGEEWLAIDPYCFVKPVKKEKVEQSSGGIILTTDIEDNHKGNVRHIGIMMYPNKRLQELGIQKGDKVVFSKNSEYEFNINGEIFYKMSTKDIMAKLE